MPVLPFSAIHHVHYLDLSDHPGTVFDLPQADNSSYLLPNSKPMDIELSPFLILEFGTVYIFKCYLKLIFRSRPAPVWKGAL